MESFIVSLGYEPVLSEKGNIAYSPEMPLDESCYIEVENTDIFILIIGGRYGSEMSNEKIRSSPNFYERYESITKQEHKSALSKDIPVYILIESNVYTEYQTFLKNKGNKDITYAHADSVNIFTFIEEILSPKRNNPMHTFERYTDVEDWLKEQWGGLFRELLHRLSGQQQLATLSGKVAELGDINETLRRYLETIVSKISPDDSTKIIKAERKRLEEAREESRIEKRLFNNTFIGYLTKAHGLEFETAKNLISKATTEKNILTSKN